ncbi:FG-GAP-like repeat-containing protein [Flavobacteriaceae bacterium 14752]|uniref:FG-GAP-like repeat-containing protein n=1 Tax=Mesohalobacter salilacus TaxID=2491711 RepID=UPI000F637A3F|nr:T9SS C-terminal target domain-containing protein [Flavobacteriaceae bacterium 14752]
MKYFYFCCLFCFSFLCFSQIQFSDIAQTSGLNNTQFGFGTLGAGISFYDFNQDGLDDITMATDTPQNVRFFENNSSGFTEVNFNGISAPYENKSVIWVDYDNDGDLDFYVTNYLSSNHLYQNDGNYNFTEVSQTAGLTESFLRSWGASWADYDKDGDLDLLILHRDGLNQLEHNILYKNNGDGTFSDVTNVAGLSMLNHMSFCAAFFDYNNDGWLDIYIANDKMNTSNLLYKNNGDGTFTDVSAVSQSNIIMDAMSTTISDYNQDGYFDVYITNTSAGNVFLNNNGDGTFSDVATLTNTTFNSVGWGAVFLDADLDADLDLYVSGSADGSQGTPSAAFYEQIAPDNFTELANAMPNDDAISFSNAKGDYDNDGKPDVVVLNFSPNDLFLWQNTTQTTNNWTKIKLKGSISNSMAIGAVIELTPENSPTQYELVMCGEGYIAQNSAFEFFGLGNAQNIENITIKWPNGLVESYQNLQVNKSYTIEEGTGILSTNNFQLSQPKVFPNPAVSEVNISSNSHIKKLHIYSLQGKLLFQNSYNQTDINLNIQNLANGIYILELESEKRSFKQKLIVQH